MLFLVSCKKRPSGAGGIREEHAKAHKIELECMVKATDLQLLKEKMKSYIVADLSL